MINVYGLWFPDPDAAVKWPVDPKDVAPGGTYQLDQYEACMKRCRRRHLAVDVGAHVGSWARLLARDFEWLIAFEPYPPFFACLERNLAARGNVTLRQQAVGEISGPAGLIFGPNEAPRLAPDGQANMPTSMVALDDCGFVDLDFLKIDVEGYEAGVLHGAEELIERDHPVVRLEQHPSAPYRPQDHGFAWDEALDFLRIRGYQVDKIGKIDWLCWRAP
jgi:FkbM family methyltransferase